MTDLRESLI
jgi:hypothetical protein